jgi:hypothetical protein
MIIQSSLSHTRGEEFYYAWEIRACSMCGARGLVLATWRCRKRVTTKRGVN